MVRLTYIITLYLLILTNCGKQKEYSQPTDIVDRTEEFLGTNIWVSLEENESIDGYTRVGNFIFGGEIACNVEPLKNIDIKTFKVLAGTQYAKDTNRVYYPLRIHCIDYIDCGVCYYADVIVKGANPKKFKYLSKDYATDGKHAFFRGERLKGADGATFKVIEGPKFFFFATDKNHVYKHDKIFRDADPSTFYYGETAPRNRVSEFDNRYIIGDKNNKWEFIPPDKITTID